ncbi:MAG: hypothetical protein ACYDBQ_07160 [Thermoplasmatota archaeon]
MSPRIAPAIILGLVVPLLSVALASDPAAGIPPDGQAGPTVSLSAVRSSVAVGSEVTTTLAVVTSVNCPNCEDPTTAADFTIAQGSISMRVHVQNTWQATYNVKKQNFVPAVGQNVVVQGRVQLDGSGNRFIEMKRFGEHDHSGPNAHAYDVAAGSVAAGSYVWLDPVQVLNVGRWDDGDYSFDVRDPAGGGMVHLEMTPPFQTLSMPHVGDTVRPFGRVHLDGDHDWWELHPVRCWSPGACVADSANPVDNGPAPGTPASGGYYPEAGPVPLWVPMSGGGGGSGGNVSVTFTIHSPNQWWEEVTMAPTQSWSTVAVRVNSGAWQNLSPTSWGTWAISTQAVAGSSVEFLATDSTGATAQSMPFHWLDGNLNEPSTGGSSGGTPPPPSGNLTAKVAPSPNSNEWWVQATVTASSTLTVVDASVDNGTWVALDLSSWGDWVKSIHAPTGSMVRFRVVATDGHMKVTPGVLWPPGPQPPFVDPPLLTVDFQPVAKPAPAQANGSRQWVDVMATPSRPLALVSMQSNYGAWQPLVRQADGSWGGFVNVTDGPMNFDAFAPDGGSAYSYAYVWPFLAD